MAGTSGIFIRAKLGWMVLVCALVVEAFGGLLLLVPTVSGMLAATEDPLGARLSIFLSALLAWAWVCATLFGALRSRANWVRGSALTIHVLLFAAGTGMLQLALGDALLAWASILLSLVGFVAAILARPLVQPELTDGAGEGLAKEEAGGK